MTAGERSFTPIVNTILVRVGGCGIEHPVRRLRSAADAIATGRRAARLEGFRLHADVAVPARERDQLERVVRYLVRPPLAQD